jgi:hypothetical protein
MSESQSLVQPGQVPDAVETGCRAWVRHSPRQETHSYLMPLSEQERFPARVQNLSTGGVGLHLERPIDLGRFIFVELVSHTGHFSRLLLTRVVHLSEHPEGGYVLGGEFIGTLAAKELQFLIA